MGQLISSPEGFAPRDFTAPERVHWRTRAARKAGTAKWMIRYTFYALVFSLPFEEALIAGGATLPKLFGVALAGVALLQPKICYSFPPKAFRWFLAYLLVHVLYGGYLILTPPNVPEFTETFIRSAFRLVQLGFLFWLSYNLLRDDQIAKGALWAFAVATILLSALQIVGITSDVSGTGRMTAFDGNPNGLATVLSLGLIALFGLAYGRVQNDWKERAVFWLASGIIAIAIVKTGSRGAIVAIAGTLMVFFLNGKTIGAKLKFGALVLASLVLLVVASYQIDAVRVRWEQAFYEESLGGRERIFPAAVDMILDSPAIGWGPIVHLWELGPRLGLPMRDEHNSYLYLLAEVGIVGALPFFIGLWLCLRSAWRARRRLAGFVPLLMLMFILLLSVKGTLHHRKYYWLVLAYALAASTYTARPKYLNVTVLTNHHRASETRKQERLARSRFHRARRP